jgi:OsmC subfamily peroxiredoxin
MAIRSAHTAWTGTLMEGSGRVDLTSSGAGSYDVSFPKRTSDDADGTTSPEELIAAAHSSCYSMALSGNIADAGGTPGTLDVTADVRIGPDPPAACGSGRSSSPSGARSRDWTTRGSRRRPRRRRPGARSARRWPA